MPPLIKGKRALTARCQHQCRAPACSESVAVVPRLVRRDPGANADAGVLVSVFPEGRTKPGQQSIGQPRRHPAVGISLSS